MEQIRSSVNLSFHSFSGTEDQSKRVTKEPTGVSHVSQTEEPPTVVGTESTFEDIIMLEDKLNKDESIDGSSSPEIADTPREESPIAPISETNKEDDETMSLSELSTSFQQCCESINQNRKVVKVKKSKEPSGPSEIKPFDYEAARKQVKFGEDAEEEPGSQVTYAGKKKNSAAGRLQIDDGNKQFAQARRRQAFPASGNRSATFR